jgi:hypothetical protein
MKITIELYPEMLTADDRRLLRLLAGEEAVATGGVETTFDFPADEPIRAGGTSSDDADERVVRDWTPAPPLPERPRAVGRLLVEIPRDEVTLKVGDKVKTRSGEGMTVSRWLAQPPTDGETIIMDNGRSYYANGTYFLSISSGEDVVEVNGARIVDEDPS